MRVRIARLNALAQLPVRASAQAAGMDLCAALPEPITLAPTQRALVPTGLVIELPEGTEGQIRPRSGLAAKQGVTVINAPGTVDADYRGEVKVALVNLGQEPVKILPGDRIAQLVICPVLLPTIEEAQPADLTGTERGTGGFGSTGR